jgi:hypothetical protein
MAAGGDHETNAFDKGYRNLERLGKARDACDLPLEESGVSLMFSATGTASSSTSSSSFADLQGVGWERQNPATPRAGFCPSHVRVLDFANPQQIRKEHSCNGTMMASPAAYSTLDDGDGDNRAALCRAAQALEAVMRRVKRDFMLQL